MIPGGWNSPREVGNVQNIPDPIEGTLEKKIMNTGEWNSQWKANITLKDPGNVDTLDKIDMKCFISCNNIQSHEESWYVPSLSLCSAWQRCHLKEPHKETRKDAFENP